MSTWNVQMEDADGQLQGWTGEAEDSGQAADLALEQAVGDVTVIDVEEEM